MERGRKAYGLIPELEMLVRSLWRNSSFWLVRKPIGLERLMCNGNGAPRSLVKNVCILLSSDVISWTSLMIFFRDAASVVEGCPCIVSLNCYVLMGSGLCIHSM